MQNHVLIMDLAMTLSLTINKHNMHITLVKKYLFDYLIYIVNIPISINFSNVLNNNVLCIRLKKQIQKQSSIII